MGTSCSNQSPHAKIFSNPAIVIRLSSGSTAGSKELKKHDSDLNLIPLEMHKQWFQSEESRFEREKYMLVLCTAPSQELASRLCIIDVDPHSKSYSKVIQQLRFPYPGDELIYSALIHEPNRETTATSGQRNPNSGGYYLTSTIVPCHNSSRIYVIGVDIRLKMRVIKLLSKDDFSRMDLSCPLSVCNVPSSTKRSRPVVCFLAGKDGQPKGALFQIGGSTGPYMEHQQSSVSQKNGAGAVDSPQSPAHSPNQQRPKFGGNLVLQAYQGTLFTTECCHPEVLGEGLPFGRLTNNARFGSTILIWDAKKKTVKQTIRLGSPDGCMPSCIRMFHHSELNHGYACTAIGGSIFHLHKNSRTGQYSADRVAKLPPAVVEGWLSVELLAFPTDMVVSMDDTHLYVACWLQGFIAQFNISDPFRPTLLRKFSMGGVLRQKSPSSTSKIVLLQSHNMEELSREPTMLCGSVFEGGPARLQLSMDCRRLYVSNSTVRAWNEQIYPSLKKRGSSIGLINIDVGNENANMALDTSFAVHFKLEANGEQGSGENEDKPLLLQPFFAGEMRFLNGDSTSESRLRF